MTFMEISGNNYWYFQNTGKVELIMHIFQKLDKVIYNPAWFQLFQLFVTDFRSGGQFGAEPNLIYN